MGKRGPAPISSEVRRLRGNPSHRKLGPNELKPEIAAPDPPAHLSPEARIEWDRIVKELLALRVVSKLDMAALSGYCQSWARHTIAEREISKEGVLVRTKPSRRNPQGRLVPNPYLTISNAALKMMKTFLTELGLSPSCRLRISGAAELPDEDDETARFLFGPRGSDTE